MDDNKKNRCAHTGCSCLVGNDSRYCSPHCETLKTGPSLPANAGTHNVPARLIEQLEQLDSVEWIINN